jgi:hypothetical protein
MRSTRRSFDATILSLVLLLIASVIPVRAQDDDAEEYDEKARVARISLIRGGVNLKRNSNSDWERARLSKATRFRPIANHASRYKSTPGTSCVSNPAAFCE